MTDYEELNSAFWSLVELEAIEKYYLWNDENGFSEKPTITINKGFTQAPDAKPNEKFTVYLGFGVRYWNYISLKEARNKVGKILRNRKARIISENEERVCEFPSINTKKEN